MCFRAPFLSCLIFAVSSILIAASHGHGDGALAHPVRRSIADGQTLRILPIGDSITWGYLSSNGDGYRLDLVGFLSSNPVQYIGSQHSGNMTNDNNEGHIGATINEIAAFVAASGSLAQQPNLILLMAGTNDMDLNLNVTTAPDRLGNLIDEITAVCTDAAILVAEITPMWGQPGSRVIEYNAAIPSVVAARVKEGRHVLTVNMSAHLTASDLRDGIHPTDGGYQKMADVWYAGIQQLSSMGWIKAPLSVTTTTSSTSSSTPVSTKHPNQAPRNRGIGSGFDLWVSFVSVVYLVGS